MTYETCMSLPATQAQRSVPAPGSRPAPAPSGRPASAPASSPVSAERAESFPLTLVNAEHPLPRGNAPELSELERGLLVDVRIVGPAQRMLTACRAAGLDPYVTSAWRDRPEQLRLLVRKTLVLISRGRTPAAALRLARRFVATPGTSEHELGLALDICSERMCAQGHAEVQAWLATHSWRFGFVCRYPANKSHVTGIAHEPWHFRYVGLDAAREMHTSSLCLEEYLKVLNRLP